MSGLDRRGLGLPAVEKTTVLRPEAATKCTLELGMMELGGGAGSNRVVTHLCAICNRQWFSCLGVDDGDGDPLLRGPHELSVLVRRHRHGRDVPAG